MPLTYTHSLLTHAIGYVGNWQAFLVILILVQLGSIAIVCRLLRIDIAFPLLLYVSLLPGLDMLANGLRQGVGGALGLLVWALTWHRGSLSRLWLLVPMAFHKSMLILVPFVLVSRGRYRWLLVFTAPILFVFALLMFSIYFFSTDPYSPLISALEFLTFAVVGTDLSFGEKLFGYVNPDEDIISPTLEVYFALIPLGSLLVSAWAILRGSYVSATLERHRALLVLFTVSIVPYIVLFPTPYSYRFMYIAYPPAVLLLSFAYRQLNSIFVKLVAVALVYASGIATYGSATFNSFRYSLL